MKKNEKKINTSVPVRAGSTDYAVCSVKCEVLRLYDSDFVRFQFCVRMDSSRPVLVIVHRRINRDQDTVYKISFPQLDLKAAAKAYRTGETETSGDAEGMNTHYRHA